MRDLDLDFPRCLPAVRQWLNSQGNGDPPDLRPPRLKAQTVFAPANPESDAKRSCLLHEQASRCPLRGTADYAAERARPRFLVLGSEDVQPHRHLLAFRRESHQPSQEGAMPAD